MTQFIQVAPGISVAPQLTLADFEAAAQAGIKSVICNRPDGEQPGQPTLAQAEAAAKAAGLAFRAVPISGGPNLDDVDAMARALAETPGPHLAYCRSGTRSITVWALSQAKARARSADDLVELAAAAGYDLAGLRPTLARLAQG